MKIINNLIVRKRVYQIIECDNGEYVWINDEQCVLGRCNCHDKNIYIHKNQDAQLKKETLAHEIAHAYINEYCLGDEKFFDEEQICDFVAKYGPAIIKETNRIINKN